MIKFLKFVLFIIVIAFAFALGVKFSDSFKGNLGNLGNDEIKVETELEKVFSEAKEEIKDKTSPEAPLTDEEKDLVNTTTETMPEFVDIEMIEPMDGVGEVTQGEINIQENVGGTTQNAPVPTTQNAPAPVVQQPTVTPAQQPVNNQVPAQVKKPAAAVKK